MNVYLLWHARGTHSYEESKLCGVFSSEEKAQEARQKLLPLPGFCNYSDGFIVEKHKVDDAQWVIINKSQTRE